MMKLNTMRTRLDGLVIFRGILQANIVLAFRAMLAAAGSEDFVSAAADFENQLFERGGSWTRVLLDAVLQDENICIRKAASGVSIWRDRTRDRISPQAMMMALAVPTMNKSSVCMTPLAIPSRMPLLAMNGVLPAAMTVVPLCGDV